MAHTIKVKLEMQDMRNNVITGTVIERDGKITDQSILDCGNHVAVTRDIVFDKNVDIDGKVITITISQ